MNKKDIRWQQRFSNYIKALKKLQQAIEFANSELQKKEIEETDNEDTEILDEII